MPESVGHTGHAIDTPTNQIDIFAYFATFAVNQSKKGKALPDFPPFVCNTDKQDRSGPAHQPARAALAFSASWLNAGMSWTAISASILRSMATPALFRPSIMRL